jgi:hypothetical protein
MAFWEGVIYVGNAAAKQPFIHELIGFAPGNAFITVETNSIRYRYGGATPDVADGHLLEVGQSIVVHAPDVENFKAISTSANGSKLVATIKGK